MRIGSPWSSSYRRDGRASGGESWIQGKTARTTSARRLERRSLPFATLRRRGRSWFLSARKGHGSARTMSIEAAVFFAASGEDDAESYGAQADPKDGLIAGQRNVSGLRWEGLEDEPTDVLVESPA